METRYESSEFSAINNENSRRVSENNRSRRRHRHQSETNSACSTTVIAKVLFGVGLLSSLAVGVVIAYTFFPFENFNNRIIPTTSSFAIMNEDGEEVFAFAEREPSVSTAKTTTEVPINGEAGVEYFDYSDDEREKESIPFSDTLQLAERFVNDDRCGVIDKYATNSLLMRSAFDNLVRKIGHLDEPYSDSSSEGTDKRMGRIVGGKAITIKSHPWQVSLWTNLGHTCGGSLISSNWIITAAHCTAIFEKPEDWRVFLGETNRLNMEPGIVDDGLQLIHPSHVITHPYFNPDNYENDIALIRLQQHVTFSEYTNSVCIPPTATKLPNGTRCLVTGWGLTEEGGESPDVLQQASVDMIDLDICNKPSWLMNMVSDLMVCAGTVDGSQDACQGDSGGPLVCLIPNVKKQTFFLVGAVSWGIGCGTPKMPGVYTDISLYTDWIRDTISSNN